MHLDSTYLLLCTYLFAVTESSMINGKAMHDIYLSYKNQRWCKIMVESFKSC
jgi:hypothetical protein